MYINTHTHTHTHTHTYIYIYTLNNLYIYIYIIYIHIVTYRLLGVNRDLPVKWHGTINLFVSGRARDLFRECGPWDVRGTINTYSLLYNDSLMFIHLI